MARQSLKERNAILEQQHNDLVDQLNLHRTYVQLMEQQVMPKATAWVDTNETPEHVSLQARLYHIGRPGHGWDLVVVNQYNEAGSEILPWATLLLSYERFEETKDNAWRPIRTVMQKLLPAIDEIRRAA